MAKAKSRNLGSEPPAYVEPLRVSMEMAAYLVGESRARLYEKVRDGKLRTVKEGRMTLVTMTELRRYVAVTDPAAASATGTAQSAGAAA
jgi:hypothetical protein